MKCATRCQVVGYVFGHEQMTNETNDIDDWWLAKWQLAAKANTTCKCVIKWHYANVDAL